ncbi:MAG: APC family permease [Bacteroidota bacterium]|nr:APC family permease [Bacteroidota bacterium]
MKRTGKKLKYLPLAAVIFFTVSGGPYGLEPLLTYAGRNGALLLLMIVPLLWDIPAILTVYELNGMMPVNGGYYQWVKRALGLRFAFYEGWWTWLYTFVDLAIYPVLFIEYATFFFPEIAAYKIPVCLVIIWSGAILNIRGIVPVGKASLLLSLIVLVPFLLLFGKAFFVYKGAMIALPQPSLKGIEFSSLGMAIYTIMWNFIGWDNASTYAEEVERPVRTYIVSTLIAFIGILIVYFLALQTAGHSGIDLNFLKDNGFPYLGVQLGGQWLGTLLAIGGMASTVGLFFAVLLSVSRIPKAMADDALLPAIVHAEHKKFKTPYISILICATIVSFMILFTFSDLVFIDVTLYGGGLLLEFISLLALRIKAPDEKRPFKIPLNNWGIAIMILLPLSVLLIALIASCTSGNGSHTPIVFALLALVSPEIIWQLIKWYRKNENP